MNLKKPKFWDSKKPNVIAYILFPLAFLIQFFISNSKKNNLKKFKIKTICVGNIYLGGTGKTSLSIKLNQLLMKEKIKSCFIKKFYNNQVDEQKLLKSKGKLFVSHKRIEAIKQAENENYEIAILDDGLQDNTIKYDLSFVCFNNINWIGNGMTVPSGPLREKIENLRKYHHVFLNGNLENLDFLKKEILRINPEINIHVGKYKPTNIDEFPKKNNYLAFSGIGNHQTFVSMLKNHGLIIVKDIEFPDHYNYSRKDLDVVIDKAKYLNSKIITTEKDYVRFKNFGLNEIKYIKSRIEILDEEKFIKSII